MSHAGSCLWAPIRVSGRALFVCVIVVSVACGKKGPPLAPLVVLPAPVRDLAAQRQGSNVNLKFTIPDRNQDGQTPADLKEIDVYGFTGNPVDRFGRALDDKTLLEAATLVGIVEVRPPDAPPPSPPDGKAVSKDAPAPVPPAAQEVAADPRPKQGEVAIVSETLTPEAMIPVAPEKINKNAATPPEPIVEPFEDTLFAPSISIKLPPPVATRHYLTVGLNRKGDKSRLGTSVQVPLTDPPPPPLAPCMTYTVTTMNIEWQEPPDAPRSIQLPASGSLLAGTPILQQRETYAYNIYSVGSDATGPSAGSEPLNKAPLTSVSFTDPRTVEFGIERCYVLTTLQTVDRTRIESTPSDRFCVTPIDAFPPLAPKNLAAVGSEGVISLIWEPNEEADLAGYLVLRGEAPGATLQRLTPEPIRESTFRDTNVQPGTRYVYAVVALDNSTPANVSGESNRAEEAAR